ncbi:uncharacterized protein FTJAE_3990 [Fusarium tjaetaba]|uniref:Uncharacterized protein n=1 Tax=Fusarium tjaetaba TaxID=1567544 RepID=A0A8H5VZX9_9HYPO|nr:uncharacterized protein FTJAE_3990 [Fusarium tjaetaba]KAF5641731.1 hypothetical protein FTJAE_3990 [Fusarium tjaetaba]
MRACRRDVAVVAEFDDLQEGLIVKAVFSDSRTEALEFLRLAQRLAQRLAYSIVDHREEVWSRGCDLRACRRPLTDHLSYGTHLYTFGVSHQTI